MSKLKQMQLNIAHLIDNTADQEALVGLFIDVKTGGATAMMREKNMRTIIDLRSIYGKKLDEAVATLSALEQSDNLTECGEGK
jgi:hypothetical protein